MTFWWVPAAAEASSIGFHTQPEADRVRDAAQSRSTRRLRVDEGRLCNDVVGRHRVACQSCVSRTEMMGA